MFGRIGYVQGGPPAGGWDVLWSHQYPFTTLPPETWRSLKPHHKINHFPGTGCFTSKPKLATLPNSFIPKAFQLPGQAEEFKKEASPFSCHEIGLAYTHARSLSLSLHTLLMIPCRLQLIQISYGFRKAANTEESRLKMLQVCLSTVSSFSIIDVN